MTNLKLLKTIFLLISILLSGASLAEQSVELHNDPHYNEIGFFDVHICNWPERTNFFKILFSSEKFEQIETMSVYTPDNKLLVNLDKSKYRNIKRKNKADKRVFIIDIDTPEYASTGWYTIEVKTKNDTVYKAKDYVVMSRLERVSEMQPAGEDKEFSMPITLQWQAVPGAKHYRAFVRDAWTGKLVFKSELLDTAEIRIPDNKLEAGGYYYWLVHARDTNEHILFGDFQMGSISKKIFFNVAE